MPKQDDPRYIQSEQSICNALARLLEEKSLQGITMSELAREANVSRGTLYAHFNNVGEAYERAVELFYEQIQTLDEHFSCAMCRGDKPVHAYCERLRNAGTYTSIVTDERFLPTTVRRIDPARFHDLEAKLREAGVPKQLAHSVYLFQMSGCHAVATSVDVSDAEWREYQDILDRFIRGGLAALGVEL